MRIAFDDKITAFLLLAAINLAVVIALVAGIELVFGHWFESFVPPNATIVNQSLSYEQNLYDPPGEIVYTRDRYGLRGVHEPVQEIELVTVGGSTTDQRYLTEGETWQDVLRALTGLRVANAGVDGMTSYGHLIVVSEWLHEIPKFSPKCYLHYMGLNDTALTQDPQIRRYDRSGKLKRHWRQTIRDRSAIARAYRNLRQHLSPPQPRRAAPVGHAAIIPRIDINMTKVDVDRSAIARFIETEYEPNLRKLIALHRQRNEIAIFVSQVAHPSLIRWKNGETFVADDARHLAQYGVALGMINNATAAICRESSDVCRFADLAGAVEFTPRDLYDLGHATPSGARKTGTYLASVLGLMCRASHGR